MYNGGGGCSIDQKPPLIKRCTTRLTSICFSLTICIRRVLLIYSNVLNLVPNYGTRTLSLVGYYGLVLLFGQIRVLCLMSSVDRNPLPLINTYPPMHITTTHNIHIPVYLPVTTCGCKCMAMAVRFTDDFPDLIYTWINFIKICPTSSADLYVFLLFFLCIIKVCRRSRRPFCFCSVFIFFIIFVFLS